MPLFLMKLDKNGEKCHKCLFFLRIWGIMNIIKDK